MRVDDALMLMLKLVLAPLLIGVASLVGRWWGPRAGGWFAALPLTSGPVVVVVAIERGPVFAAQACQGVLLALVSLAAFVLAYERASRRVGWPASSAIGCVAYLVGTWALRDVALSLVWTMLLVCGVLIAALHLMPERGARPRRRRRQPRRAEASASRIGVDAIGGKRTRRQQAASRRIGDADRAVLLRMAIAALLVAALTAAAGAVGPRMSGLLTPFPVAATILAVSTHRTEGSEAAGQLLRGLLAGLFSFALFFLIAGLALTRWGMMSAFIGATAGALALHAGLWKYHTRRAAPRAAPVDDAGQTRQVGSDAGDQLLPCGARRAGHGGAVRLVRRADPQESSAAARAVRPSLTAGASHD